MTMRKMNKITISIMASLLLSAITAVSATAGRVVGTAEGIEVFNSIPITAQAENAAAIAKVAESTSIAAPSLVVDSSTYNMVVRYVWSVGSGGDDIGISNDWSYYELVGDTTYTVYEFPDDIGTKYCTPDYFLAKSYNSTTKKYSASTTSLEHTIHEGPHDAIKYGYEAKYSMVGRLNYWMFSETANVPTSYDQTKFVWSHGASNGSTIKATIGYNNQLANIEVKVPWIGTKSSSVTVGGEKFYLRTGPNKCSIKANSSNVKAENVRFAFGVA